MKKILGVLSWIIALIGSICVGLAVFKIGSGVLIIVGFVALIIGIIGIILFNRKNCSCMECLLYIIDIFDVLD